MTKEEFKKLWEIEDLNKAIWYITDRINQLRNGRNNNNKQ